MIVTVGHCQHRGIHNHTVDIYNQLVSHDSIYRVDIAFLVLGSGKYSREREREKEKKRGASQGESWYDGGAQYAWWGEAKHGDCREVRGDKEGLGDWRDEARARVATGETKKSLARQSLAWSGETKRGKARRNVARRGEARREMRLTRVLRSGQVRRREHFL